MVQAVIVAAGSGTRMGPGVDKLFLPVAGRPLVAHTWQRFDRAGCIDVLVLVVREGMEPAFAELAKEYGFTKPYRLVAGGTQRQDSVWNGLLALEPECDVVAIQDGARACTPQEVIAATVQAARDFGAAVAAQRLTDTVKLSSDGAWIDGHLERSHLWAVQTPQTFRVEVIRQALAAVRARDLQVTDDTAACELTGQRVRLVESTASNPKVTTPADLSEVERLLQAMDRGD
jgi:2-C-methyl-D-erythritol 4-phosphate cytidylyltransferase